MKAFLASTLGCHDTVDGEKVPAALWNPNGFADLLRAALPDKVRCVLIASDPETHKINDFYTAIDSEGLRMGGINITACTMVDSRNEGDIAPLLAECDLLILCGGHVPTQNEFFRRLNLKERLAGFDGVIVGGSAGSMNACELVYAQPELEGEALDESFPRWIDGLGIARLSLVPHWQEVREETLDGLRIFEDISLPDSCDHPFYALVDGSFILCEDGHADLYGEAYYLTAGSIRQVTREGEVLRIY